MPGSEPIKDWRGTVITEGATVIYGGSVGRSIQQVEGRVADFTETGRVNVEIIRRSYSQASSYGRKIASVGPDRLTIVAGLPPTDLPEWGEKVDEARAREAARLRIVNSHDIQGVDEMHESPDGRRWPQVVWKCIRCGRHYGAAYKEECDQ